jgi:hypothetical protein
MEGRAAARGRIRLVVTIADYDQQNESATDVALQRKVLALL